MLAFCKFDATFVRALGLAAIGLSLGTVGGVGCKGVAKEEPPTACTKVGQTCKLAQGLLGVCNEAPPGSCPREPCLVCMSQH